MVDIFISLGLFGKLPDTFNSFTLVVTKYRLKNIPNLILIWKKVTKAFEIAASTYHLNVSALSTSAQNYISINI